MKTLFVMLGVMVLGVSSLAGCRASGEVDPGGVSAPITMPR